MFHGQSTETPASYVLASPNPNLLWGSNCQRVLNCPNLKMWKCPQNEQTIRVIFLLWPCMNESHHLSSRYYKTRWWDEFTYNYIVCITSWKATRTYCSHLKGSHNERDKNSDECRFRLVILFNYLICWDLPISVPSNQGHLFLSHQAGTQVKFKFDCQRNRGMSHLG